MSYKLLGSCLIFIAFSYSGFHLASRGCESPRQINQIIQCLVALKSHITYAALPLHDALQFCSQGVEGKGAEFFERMAFYMKNDSTLTPQQTAGMALGSLKSCLFLDNTERELLLYFSANLGNSSRKEQGKYLELITTQFEQLEKEAIRIKNLNAKMYRYLGVCSGMVIVILLL